MYVLDFPLGKRLSRSGSAHVFRDSIKASQYLLGSTLMADFMLLVLFSWLYYSGSSESDR